MKTKAKQKNVDGLGLVEQLDARDDAEGGRLLVQFDDLGGDEANVVDGAVDVGGLGPVDRSRVPRVVKAILRAGRAVQVDDGVQTAGCQEGRMRLCGGKVKSKPMR